MRLVPRGPFSLAASIDFLRGYGPAAYDPGPPGHLRMAFPVEGSGEPVAVCARQPGAAVLVETAGAAPAAAVRAQLARTLGLDVDGAGFPEVGQRDPVVGALQAGFPGLRPVSFASPYEAAAWALISHRVRITQAAALKARMATAIGAPVAIHGQVLHAFPAPERLARLEGFPGLTATKVERLRALGEAAAAGALDAAALRALPRQEALQRLRALPGVGPFSAELILLRGAGDPDGLPLHEPRVRHAVASAYGLPGPPGDAALTRIAEGWRPYRTWVGVLLRMAWSEAAEPPELAPRVPR